MRVDDTPTKVSSTWQSFPQVVRDGYAEHRLSASESRRLTGAPDHIVSSDWQ